MLAASSQRMYVVSFLATSAVVLSSVLVLRTQATFDQQATLVSLTKPSPMLDITPAASPMPQPMRVALPPEPEPVAKRPSAVVQKTMHLAAPPPAATVPQEASGPSNLPAGLLCIRGPWNGSTHESGGDYSIHTSWPSGRESIYSGAYEYDDPTWGGFMGYARAYLAPPWVQDLKALQDYNAGPAARHRRWPVTSYECGV